MEADKLMKTWVAGVVVSCLIGAALGSDARPKPTRRALAALDFRDVIRREKDKVFPAVVFIKCVRQGLESGKKLASEVTGSGFLISPGGEVLTNWHVVDKALETRCLLLDGRAMQAKVVGTDKDTDLALLQLRLPAGAGPLPYARMGDSDRVTEGDFVMAMGAPWGLSRSVSIGIISCTRRFLTGHSQYSLWLQTDASISPGHSGGPLVNTSGEVVGVIALGALIGGDLGFAIPANTVQHMVGQIRDHGKVQWSWTGLQLQPLKDFNRNIYFDATTGVVVGGTDPGSPARRAGVRAQDRIVKVNGQPTNARTEEDLPAIHRRLGLLPKGTPATFDLVRDGRPVRVTIVPREKGRVEGEELDVPRWDLTVKAINQFDNPDLYFYRKTGVFVYGTKMGGNASEAGLQTRDILLRIDGVEVKTLADVRKIHARTLAHIQQKHRVVVTVMRNGLQRQVVLDFLRDTEKE